MLLRRPTPRHDRAASPTVSGPSQAAAIKIASGNIAVDRMSPPLLDTTVFLEDGVKYKECK